MKEKIINDPITYSKEILGIDLSNLQEIVLSEFLIKDNNYDSAAVIVGMRSTKSMLGAIFGSRAERSRHSVCFIHSHRHDCNQ